MKKIILVANVAKEHVMKFHLPTIKRLVEYGWQVSVACGGKETIPYCHKQFVLPIDRSPFRTHFVKAIRQLRIIIRENNFDVVYCHTTVGGIVARIASRSLRKKGLRVVMFAHGTYFYKGAPLLNYVLYYPLYKYLGSITDDIFSITREDYEFTQNHYPNVEAHYVHGIGVDTSRFQVSDKRTIKSQYRVDFSIPSDAVVLIYVAEIIKNKNQKLLLQMLQLVLKVHANTFLLLVGPEHDGGMTRLLAEQLGVSEKVRFLGWRDDIPNLLAASDICTASSIREGLGLNLIEAMASGLPVVATHNSGHAEVILNDPDVGFLVPFDKNCFAERVLELIGNEQLREQMGENGKKKCIKYDNDSVLPQIVDILVK